jgi:7-cyano-7-deazaguanine synthase
MAIPEQKLAVLYSGGLDSAILICWLLRQGCRVTPIYVRTGLVWETVELRHARRFLAAVAQPALDELVVLHLPVDDVYGDHWSISGEQVPNATSPDEDVYLPGRNPLLLIKARMWCERNEISTLALGTLATNPFADATPKFLAAFAESLNLAGRGSVRFASPLSVHDKSFWMRWAADVPLELTFSCMQPQQGLHCGKCNKCAERRTAFRLVGRADLTNYAPAEVPNRLLTSSHTIATNE